jgi:hypothetical protein
MAYTTIDDPSAYFQTTLYSGTGSQQSITNGGNSNLQPDWLWIKERTGTSSHQLVDSVRGYYLRIESDNNSAELDAGQTGATYQNVTSFDSDGFGVKNGGAVNASGDTYVAWQWKAGTSFTNDASSTGVGSIDSSGSVSTTAGFSIISWTGSGSGATIAHGIGVQPQIVFVKNRDDTASWNVYTVIGGGGKGLFLNDTAGFDSDSSYFNNGTASTTTFPVGTANTSNGSSDNMIAYCFANVKGYSKIGSYTGNGNADGTFVYTGFKPAWVLCKTSSIGGEDWIVSDNKRNPFNETTTALFPNTASGDQSSNSIDMLSNGFKMRTTGTYRNQSGVTYIYMAFAESPFVNSNGVPNNAR